MTFSGNTVSYASVTAGTIGLHISNENPFGPAWNTTAVVNANNSISNASTGILVTDIDARAGATTTVTITGNASTINSNTIGIDIDAATVSITNNTMNANGTGVRVRNNGTVTALTGNFITNSTTAAVQVASTGGTITSFRDNDLTTPGAGVGVKNDAAPTVNASMNWWGSNDQAAVAAEFSGNVDVTPWLDSGTDTNAAVGFQPSHANVNVGLIGQQTGATGRIREGIVEVTAGGNVFVWGGATAGTATYLESDISVDKAVTIDGVKPSGGVDPIVAPAIADAHAIGRGQVFAVGTHNAFVMRSNNVTVKD